MEKQENKKPKKKPQKRIIRKLKDPLNALKTALKNSRSEFPLIMVEETLLRYFNELEPKEKRQWLKLVAEFWHHFYRSEGGSDAGELDEMEERLNELERTKSQGGTLEDV